MDRRDFLKTSSAAALAVGTAVACGPEKASEVQEFEYTGMPVRENGEDRIGLLGYGCMRWPTIKGEDGKNIIDQEKVNEMVDRAIEAGVNYFDSSPQYIQAMSETATATALLRHPREKYLIATKLSNFSNYTTEASKAMYRHSFEIYQTDHIDYYLLHSIGDVNAFNKRFLDNGMIDFLMEEREKGHVRNLGFSTHGNLEGVRGLLDLHEKYHWDFVQIQMNYVDWTHAGTPARDLYNAIQEKGIPVIVMEPLLGGRLSKMPDSTAEILKEADPTHSTASWAFRFAGHFPGVITVLSGMSRMEHLEDNINTFTHFKYLSDSELEMLEKVAGLFKSFPIVDCNYCQYCMPCPWGIDIPGIFKHYNDSINAHSLAQSKEQEDFKRLKRAYLKSYDKAIESIRQADHCINCGACLRLCPQHIKIPNELARIDRYVEKLKTETL